MKCIDCRHSKCDGLIADDWNMYCTLFVNLSPVTGKSNNNSCKTVREIGKCGMEGKYWEPSAMYILEEKINKGLAKLLNKLGA